MKSLGAKWKRRIWKATQRSWCVRIKESWEFAGGFLSRGERRLDSCFRRSLGMLDVARGRCVTEKEKQEAGK